MEAPEDKQKKHESKKHIEFKDVDKHEGQKRELGHGRGRSSKLGPKYDRELKKFREETLQKIKIFRNARVDWIRLTGGEVDGQKIDSKIYYGLEIDKRRTVIMKKLGFKTNMVRPHRKTLRPRRYFTMKKKISVLESDRGGLTLGPERLKESPVIREFRKKAKKAALKMARKKELESQKLRPHKKSDAGEKASKSPYNDKVSSAEPYEDQSSNIISINDDEIPVPEQSKTEEGDVEDKELLTEDVKEVGELLSKESKMEFEKILKELKISFGFDENSITDEDTEEMKKLWKEYRLGTVKPTKKKPQPYEKLEEPSSLRFLQKFTPKKGKWWRKQKKETDYKTKWPKAVKPCTCQILEGDSVVIVKNVCECALQCKRTRIITGTETEETPSSTDTKVVTVCSKPGLPNNIASKIVDSLEVIRKRVVSKASRISKTSMKENEDEENASDTGGKPQKVMGNEIKDIYVPDQKFDSATSILEKSLNIETNEENKAVQDKKAQQSQESGVGALDEEVKTLTGPKKKSKTKKIAKTPQKDDIVPPKIQNKKAGSSKEQQNSSKELAGVKEGGNRKETKPRKTSSAVSGKAKTDAESETAKALDDSGALKTESEVPKPILGKAKRRKTKVNQGRVSFDVEAGQSPSNSILKYGEKKMKTVLSVVNIIKKK